jgi:hypothetical protein
MIDTALAMATYMCLQTTEGMISSGVNPLRKILSSQSGVHVHCTFQYEKRNLKTVKIIA